MTKKTHTQPPQTQNPKAFSAKEKPIQTQKHDWREPNPSYDFFTQLVKAIIYQSKRWLLKTKPYIEAERNIPLSSASVNGLLYEHLVLRFSKYFDSLEVELHESDFTVTGKITLKQITAEVSGKFNLVNYVFNENTQQMVYQQITPTKILSIHYPSLVRKLQFKTALFYIKHIKQRDFFGFGLAYFSFVTVKPDFKKGDTITFDFSKYINRSDKAVDFLQKFRVNHALIQNHKLILQTQLITDGFTKKDTDI